MSHQTSAALGDWIGPILTGPEPLTSTRQTFSTSSDTYVDTVTSTTYLSTTTVESSTSTLHTSASQGVPLPPMVSISSLVSSIFNTTLTTKTVQSSTHSVTTPAYSPDTPRPTPTLRMNAHHSHTAIILLPVIFILLIPFAVAVALLVWRRVWPDHYIRNEDKCPIRRTIRCIKNVSPVLAIRQRRERNRGIRERQKRYMTRRTRARPWTRIPSVSGRSNVTFSGRDQDAWLQRDMTASPGEKSSPLRSVLSARSLRESQAGISTGSPPQSTPRSGTETRGSVWWRSFATTESSTEKYIPGRLTGDGQADRPTSIRATKSLSEMVKAQREKVLKEEGMQDTI